MCVNSLTKWVLIIANVIFALLGIAVMSLGIYALIQSNHVVELLPIDLSGVAIFIIVLGSIVFIISYLACCGAYKESRCMLLLYAIVMAILAGLKIYLTVVIFEFLEGANTSVTDWLMEAFGNNNLRPAYNVMETAFQCCGTTGAEVYATIGLIPPSCCATPVNDVCEIAESYTGCIGVVTNYFDSFGHVIGSVLVAVICIELLCVFFGLSLSCVIRRKSR